MRILSLVVTNPPSVFLSVLCDSSVCFVTKFVRPVQQAVAADNQERTNSDNRTS